MKVLIVSSICPKAIERLREQHDVLCAFGAEEAVLRRLIKDREILICRSGVRITAEVLKCAPQLKLLVRAGSGTDNVDVDYLDKRGIPFFRIAGPGAQAVAEMSFALMLALARNLMRADSLTRKGRWAKEELIGCSLTGKVLGIVGAGNIGTRVGELGAAWGMRPIGCVESPTPTMGAELRGKGIQLATFDEVVSQADFLSIHVPLSDSTHKLIGADVLSRMKVGSFLINLARGGVVDEKALYEELTEGTRLRGAALDVHEAEGEGKISPLAALPNVILTPHIGAMTSDAQSEIGRGVNAIIDSFTASYPVLTGQESVLSFGFPRGARRLTRPKFNCKQVRKAYGAGKAAVSRGTLYPRNGSHSKYRTLKKRHLMKKTTQFKQLLLSGQTEFLMEAHNGLSARIVEEAGFKAIWASGLSISAALGVRDNNEASWTQVLEVVEFMSDATNIPILLDGDTGYGNFNNMRRLVRKLEQRNVAAVCIEDKLFPKTNSFIKGEAQPLADIEEFSNKIKAAKDTQQDPDFCVVARVEAFIAGRGLTEALTRAEAYYRAGADAILIHSKLSTPDQILEFMGEWTNPCPVVIVPTMYYATPTRVFEDAGVSVVIWANHLLRSGISTMQQVARTIYQEQSLLTVEEDIASVDEVFRLQGEAELRAAEKKYLPAHAASEKPIVLARRFPFKNLSRRMRRSSVRS